ARGPMAYPPVRGTHARSEPMGEPGIQTGRIGVDIGGTFTDLVWVDETTGAARVDKLLTTPKDPSQAVEQGVVTLLREAGAAPAPPSVSSRPRVWRPSPSVSSTPTGIRLTSAPSPPCARSWLRTWPSPAPPRSCRRSASTSAPRPRAPTST